MMDSRNIVRMLDVGLALVVLVMVAILGFLAWTIRSNNNHIRATEQMIIERQLKEIVIDFRGSYNDIYVSSRRWLDAAPQRRALITLSPEETIIEAQPHSQVERILKNPQFIQQIKHSYDVLSRFTKKGDRQAEFVMIGEGGGEHLALIMPVEKDGGPPALALSLIDFVALYQQFDPLSIEISPVRAGQSPVAETDGSLTLRSVEGNTIGTLVWRGKRPYAAYREYILLGAAFVFMLGLTLLFKLRNLWNLVRSRFMQELKRVEVLAYSDPLTGLPNRLALLDFLKAREKIDSDEEAEPITVVFLDIDGLKAINETISLQAGDLYLTGFAAILQEVFTHDVFIARLGGDEFAAIIPGTTSEAQLFQIHNHITHLLMTRDIVSRLESNATISMGAANSLDHPGDAKHLLKLADIALSGAKSLGKGTFCAYSSSLLVGAGYRQTVEKDLHIALRENQLYLVHQPIFSAKTGNITGYESLIRWNHPQKGMIPPSEFIPVAEAAGDLITKITKFVLDKALFELKEIDDCSISINVSGRDLVSEGFTDFTLQKLEEHGIAATRLCLELTETSFIAKPEQVALVMDLLRDKGIRFAIDDFGAGYSSLGYLLKFRFDVLKIDRDFILSLHSKPEASMIVTAITSLAQGLGMQIVGEGVETERQKSFLEKAGCSSLQGYLLGHPRPIKTILEQRAKEENQESPHPV